MSASAADRQRGSDAAFALRRLRCSHSPPPSISAPTTVVAGDGREILLRMAGHGQQQHGGQPVAHQANQQSATRKLPNKAWWAARPLSISCQPKAPDQDHCQRAGAHHRETGHPIMRFSARHCCGISRKVCPSRAAGSSPAVRFRFGSFRPVWPGIKPDPPRGSVLRCPPRGWARRLRHLPKP